METVVFSPTVTWSYFSFHGRKNVLDLCVLSHKRVEATMKPASFKWLQMPTIHHADIFLKGAPKSDSLSLTLTFPSETLNLILHRTLFGLFLCFSHFKHPLSFPSAPSSY